MSILLRIISILGLIVSFGGAIYIFKIDRDIKKMQIKNKKMGEYIKGKDYLVMKNDGEHPCDINEQFNASTLSQGTNCIIRRKYQWLH